MTKVVFHPDMMRFYLAYSDDLIWRQPVAKLLKNLFPGRNQIWPQAVAKLDEGHATTKFLRQLVAQIDWKDRLPMAKQLTDAVRATLPPRR